ncbi:hypothetical protein DXA94_10120 [Agathobaculum butyriciproducens]|nr:hypothetical protein DXA94_10120 [Agathobaculum butyriciproducens]
MLANQSDFMAYASALKSNYRKGVHRLETILSNPTMSAEFAANLGGVSVVLGVPISMPDRNSDKLLELLLGSAVADNAVETWLHQFYEFTDWDDLLSDSARCQEMANNPLIWRAAGGSKLAVGKSIATLAGLSCAAYKDIDAVAASQVAMAAVAASQVAVAAIVKSPVAMAAMWRSDTAIKALQANATAWKTFTGASSAVMGKTVAILANLDPSGYADMTAIAASQVAMTAIIGNPTALNAVVTSQVAMAAVAASAVALNAICKNATARSAFIGSSYRDTYYSKILSSLQNTAYFTVVINAGAMTNTTSLLYYNGTKQAVSTALSADDSFILIPTLQSYNSSSYCYVYDLQTGSTIAHYTHDRLTTANLVIPGGVRASNIYGGSGHTTYYVFKAK